MLTLDAGSGYWQLPVDDKRVKLLTLKKHGIDIYRNVPKKTVEDSCKGIPACGDYSRLFPDTW